MSNSRREFLKRGTLMALVAGVPMGLSEKASTMGLTGTSNASGLSLAAFESQIDTTFLDQSRRIQSSGEIDRCD